MKFTEGYWLSSERSNALFAAHAYYAEEIPGGMRIVAPTKVVKHRGDTLDISTITLEFRACAQGMISVKAWHFEAYDNHLPEFEKAETSCEAKVHID